MKIANVSILCVALIFALTTLTACRNSIETVTITESGPATTITTTKQIPWFDIPTYTFTEKITVSVGEEFAIALYITPMFEGLWNETYDGNLIVLLESKYKDHATSIPSRAGDQYFIFKALKQGNTEIKFVSSRDERSFQIEIKQ
jgi:hypothetical protein